MPALTLSDFKKGNIFFTLIVVAAVSILLFIPDLIGINSVSILEHDTELLAPEEEQVAEVPADEVLPVDDVQPLPAAEENYDETLPVSLVDIQNLLETNYIDQLVEDKVSEKREKKYSVERAQPDPEIFEEDTRFSLGLPKLYDNKSGHGQIRVPTTLTWKFLQSKAVRRNFADLHVSATSVAAAVNDRFQATKYSMYDYSTTVKAMADGSQRFRTPEEAIEYLQHLDRQVFHNIEEEGAPREIALRWSKISLEPILGRAEERREELVPKLDPHLKIIGFSVQTQQARKSRNSSLDLRMLNIKFSLRGTELVSVQAKVNNTIAPYHYFMPNSDEVVRTAEFKQLPLEGPITFIVRDQFGYSSNFVYDFTPLLNIGSWYKSEETGLYELRLSRKLLEGPGLNRFLKGGKQKSSSNGLFVQNGPLPYVVF